VNQLLKKLAEKTGKPLREYESVWRDCRAAVVEKYGDKRGTYEYVRTVLEFLRRTGLTLTEISL